MLTAVVLVQLGAIAHATWNLLATRGRGDGRLFVWAYSLCSIALLAPAAVIVLMVGEARPSWVLVGASLLSGLLHGGYALALQAAYTRADLNVAYPVARGLGPVLVVFWAVLVLAEPMRALGWCGLGLTVAGVVVVSAGGGAGRARAGHGLRWGLLVAVMIAAYTLWDDYAMTALALDPVLYYVGTGVFMFLGMSLAVRRRYAEGWALLRTQWPTALAIGVLAPVSYVLVLAAMQLAPISVVAPLRSTSIAIGSIMAWLWLREPHGPRRLAGAALIMLGVVALVSQ